MGRQVSPRSAYIKIYYRKKEKNRIKEYSQRETGCSAAGKFRGGTRNEKKNAMKNLVREYVGIPGLRIIIIRVYSI